MCEICMHYPCLPGCPNEHVNSVPCSSCGEEIRIGDDYAIDEGNSMILCGCCADKAVEEYQDIIDRLLRRDTMTRDFINDY